MTTLSFIFLYAVLQTNNWDNSMVFCSSTFLNVFHLSILTFWRQFSVVMTSFRIHYAVKYVRTLFKRGNLHDTFYFSGSYG